jgi:hypothetical protein
MVRGGSAERAEERHVPELWKSPRVAMRRKAIKRRRTVAGEAKEQKQEERRSVVARTTEIAAAYITGNTVAMADVIETIGRALQALGREDTTPASARPEPAVPVRRSIQPDHLVCLVCAKSQKNPSAPSQHRAPAHAGGVPRAVRAQA